MKKYQYKTITLKAESKSFFSTKKKIEGFEEALNEHGQEGWRYVDSLSQTAVYGEVFEVKLIFEKELS